MYLLYSHLVEFSLKIYYMGHTEIYFRIFCVHGSLSQKRFPTPAILLLHYVL